MAIYRDQVARISLADLRMRFKRKEFEAVKSVVLQHLGYAAEIHVVKKPAPTCRGGYRRYLQCPHCNALVHVIGVVPGLGVACSACSGWRGRNHPVSGSRTKLAEAPSEKVKTVLQSSQEELG